MSNVSRSKLFSQMRSVYFNHVVCFYIFTATSNLFLPILNICMHIPNYFYVYLYLYLTYLDIFSCIFIPIFMYISTYFYIFTPICTYFLHIYSYFHVYFYLFLHIYSYFLHVEHYIYYYLPWVLPASRPTSYK